MLKEFRDFILRGNVVELAVAVITEIRDLLREQGPAR